MMVDVDGSDSEGMTQLPAPSEEAVANVDLDQTFGESEVVAEDVTRYVVVEINKNKYGISTDTTVELMDSTAIQITRVSHAPGYVRGVINHRGSIIPAIDTRLLLGFKSHDEEFDDLKQMLALREKDHVEWLNELFSCVETGNTFSKQVDPCKCAFGKWYDNLRGNSELFEGLTKGDTILKSIIDQIDQPHRKIHSIASEVLDLASNGKKDEAKKIIENTRDEDLASMRKLFKSLVEQVESTSVSMMIITELGSQKIGLVVDEVHSVFDCPDDSVDPLPDSTENAEFLKGLVHQDDGGYILIADIEYIYEQTSPDTER